MSTVDINSLKKELKFLFKQQNFYQAIEIIETRLYRDREKTHSYLYELRLFLVHCFFFDENKEQFSKELQKLLKDRPYDPRLMLLDAFADLKINKTSSAIYKYTQMIKLNRSANKASKILKILENKEETSLIHNFNKTKFFLDVDSLLNFEKSLYPDKSNFKQIFLFFKPKYFLHSLNFKYILYSGFGLTTLLLIYLLFSYFLNKQINNPSEENNVLPDRVVLFGDSSPSPQNVSATKLQKIFDKTKAAIIQRKINLAIRLQNQVKDYKLNPILKEKFEILWKFIPAPSFADEVNDIPLKKRIDDKYSIGTYIKIIGIIKNIESRYFLVLLEKNHKQEVRMVQIDLPPGDFYLEKGSRYEILAQLLGRQKDNKYLLFKMILIRKLR